jgi:Sulfotransferase family
MRPSFFIIGANKCGTSSLYRYILANPQVLPCVEKEPNFFGQHSAAYIASHIDEYFSLFPTCDYRGPLTLTWEASDEAGASNLTTIVVERRPDSHYITGEASANTFHHVSPSLLHQYLPDTRLIVLLRNPVDRAYSHHRMYQRFRDAGHDPGVEIGDFEADIRAEIAAHERGERTEYIGPGVYVELLRGWIATYGAHCVKVLLTEDLGQLRTAKQIMLELEDYLELPAHDYADILTRHFNRARPASINPATRSLLADFYRPHNARLQEYLGRELDWD